MKLLKNEKTENYHEIEVEYSFLFIKYKVKYRKVDGNVFRYKESDKYYPTGLSEHINVKDLFTVNLQDFNQNTPT
jgi:hypothetical protein